VLAADCSGCPRRELGALATELFDHDATARQRQRQVVHLLLIARQHQRGARSASWPGALHCSLAQLPAPDLVCIQSTARLTVTPSQASARRGQGYARCVAPAALRAIRSRCPPAARRALQLAIECTGRGRLQLELQIQGIGSHVAGQPQSAGFEPASICGCRGSRWRCRYWSSAGAPRFSRASAGALMSQSRRSPARP